MSIRLNKTMGIACLSILLQVGASSQNVARTSTSEDHDSNNSTTSSSIINDSDPMKKTTEAVMPRISPKAPEVNPSIVPSETYLSKQPFDEPDMSVLGEAQSFTATAYALKGRTRSGVYVRRGVIAADPRVLPLGSVVHIKAGKYSGVYTVQDTGKLIKGNVVDVWMPSNQEARSFGRRKIKIHVLREGRKRKK